jgi:uncharacterized membrane protein
MGDEARETGFPLLLDFYGALVASVAGVRRGGDAALAAMVEAESTVNHHGGWLIRQFREGTISWAVVAILVLLAAGVMALLAGLSRA